MLKNFFSKKPIKIILFIIAIILTIILSFCVYFLALTSNHHLDESKLIDLSRTITYYDTNGIVLTEKSNNTEIVNILELKDHTKNAFIAIEDKRFYSHNGIDKKGLLRAIIKNISTFSFKEGASTISQQLIKNTHLSSEKTFKRKLIELKLAKELEKKYSKNEILEKYLNTIYFGENCFGLAKASKYYFDKLPENLTISQSAMLAGIIKAPSNYSPINNFEKAISRRNIVLDNMFEQNFISKSQLTDAKNEKIVIKKEESLNNYSFLLKNEINNFIDKSKYSSTKLKVFTTIDTKKQNEIENILSLDKTNALKSAILCNKNGEINAFYCNSIIGKRQIGSLIKPLGVYAPAIENNIINECSLILDEKTSFNGYSPENYGNNYLGYVSAKTALAKSLNIPSVKIIQSLGTENALYYLSKLGLSFNEKDANLSLALGASLYGESLYNIVGAYTVFLNNGYRKTLTIIKEIKDENNKTIYKPIKSQNKVFNDDTTYIVNDMLKSCVENGTAKKLKELNINLRAKTGTVGCNKGNTDAYCISYNTENILGIWLGNKENEYMSNIITGGSIPCELSKKIWHKIYDNNTNIKDFEQPKSVEEVLIDKIDYEENHTVLKADINAPKRYVISYLFKNSNLPLKQSTRFSIPKIENPKSLANNKGILISLCLPEYYNSTIYRVENGNRIEIYDTFNKNKIEFIDSNILPNTLYEYIIIPYYFDGANKHYGEEKYIKVKSNFIDEINNFWEDNFE